MIMENMDIRREKSHLWVSIFMLILLSAYRLISLLDIQVNDFFLSYTSFPVVDFISNLLFFWLLGLIWIAYHHWKKAVEYNQKLEEILRSISPDAIAVVNETRKITMCSGQIESMFGIPARKLIGQSTDVLYYDRRVLGEKGEIAQRLEKYGFHVGYATGKRQDGSTFPLEIITGVVAGSRGAVVLMRDITARQKAENALRESEARFELFMRYLPGCAFIKDAEGKYLFLNRYHEKIYGWNIEDALGKSDQDLLPPDQAELIMESNRKVLQSGTEMHYTHRLEKNGKPRSMLTCTFPIDSYSSGEKLIGGISLDITEKEQAENEYRSIERQMLQAQKLESLGVLGGGIAHDFNNLLMGILGHADIALSKMPDDVPGRRNIEALISSSKRAADLANQLLAYAGKGSFVVENTNMSRLISEMANLLKVSISKNAKLNMNLSDKLPSIKCDITQIRQVVMNLIVNASDSLQGQPGEISITTGTVDMSAQDIKEKEFSTTLKPGRYVYTSVSDTGVGMDEETRQHIFDPFFTTKRSGHGLGLAAVLGIVRSHHGAIKIESTLGQGSTLSFYIPALNHSAVKSDRESSEDKTWRGHGVALVADDDSIVRQVAGMMLKSIGFKVIEVPNGREAINTVTDNPDKITCVLLDLTMPDIDGMDAYRAIRKQQPELPVILSSGYDMRSDIAKLSDKCKPGFIKKPYRIENLREVLSKLVPPSEDVQESS